MTWKEFKDFVKSHDNYIPDEKRVIISIDDEDCDVKKTSITSYGFKDNITFIENCN